MRALFVPLTLLSIACSSGSATSHGDADAGAASSDTLILDLDAGSASPATTDASTLTFDAAGRDAATVAIDARPSEAATSADVGNGASRPGCLYGANQTGLSSFQQAGGLAFHVYAPSSYDANVAHTVIVIMAGQDSDGTAEMAALWQPIADSGEPLVLLVPKGSLPATDPTTYPTGANWSVDDLNQIQDLIPEIDACYDVNVKKHILWGFSEGGFYGYLLGIGAASTFSGLAMGGSNTSFAQENGYPPSAEQWKIPVSHVQGTMDPNGLEGSIEDQAAFEAAGSVFTLYQPVQGHTITPAQVLQQYEDLKGSTSP